MRLSASDRDVDSRGALSAFCSLRCSVPGHTHRATTSRGLVHYTPLWGAPCAGHDGPLRRDTHIAYTRIFSEYLLRTPPMGAHLEGRACRVARACNRRYGTACRSSSPQHPTFPRASSRGLRLDRDQARVRHTHHNHAPTTSAGDAHASDRASLAHRDDPPAARAPDLGTISPHSLAAPAWIACQPGRTSSSVTISCGPSATGTGPTASATASASSGLGIPRLSMSSLLSICTRNCR